MLPAGGEDLDKLQGNLVLTYAADNEQPVVVLGRDKSQSPFPGEVIYKDNAGTVCRRWNWREVARTRLTKTTENAVLVLEAIGPVSDEELYEAQRELAQLIRVYCKAQVHSYTVNKDNPKVNCDIILR